MASDATEILRKPFDAAQVGKLPKPTKKDNPKGKCGECGGWHGLPAVHLDYVGHAATTARLLDADPSWTWEPVAFDANGLPAVDRNGQGAPVGLWIRLTVAGVTRLGYGSVDAGAFDAIKQLIGDALRNAAMRFGVALDLWSKEELTAPEPPKPTPPADPRIIRGGPFKGQTVDDMAATEEGRAQLLVWIADPSIRPELAEAAAAALDEHDNPVANGSGPVGAGADLQTTDEPEVGEGADKEPEEGTNAAPDPAEGSEPKMSAAQRAAIFGIAGDLEWSKEDIHAFAGIESIAALTKKQAGDLIDRMTLAEADQVREGA